MPPLASPGHTSFERTLASARTTMLFSEVVGLAIDSFRASKVRFLLTMLGMVIGSASIILVVTIGLTGRQYATSLIESIGPNEVELEYSGGGALGAPDTNQDYLTIEDMNKVQEQVPGIVAASPVLDMHDSISMGSGVVRETLVLGVTPQYRIVRNLAVVSGRFFDDEDASTRTKVAVITVPFAKGLFGSAAAAVGHTFAIRGIPFVIIGTFKESVETFGQTEIDEQTILIPYEVARYFTGSNAVKQIYFSMANANQVIPASKQVLSIIESRHRSSSVYKVQNMTLVLNLMSRIASGLTIVLTLAAAITLIVSGVGIMNSMLANVQARLKEIGIRKALGATSKEIRMQFLVEAVSISLAGGIIGVFAGLAIPLSVGFLTEYKIPVSYWSVVIALATSVLVGVIFGTLPANRAARLDPVETLKYE